jgi:hypothetical protein
MNTVTSHSKNETYTVLLSDDHGFYMVRTVKFTGWQSRPVIAETTFSSRNDADRLYNKLTAV